MNEWGGRNRGGGVGRRSGHVRVERGEGGRRGTGSPHSPCVGGGVKCANDVIREGKLAFVLMFVSLLPPEGTSRQALRERRSRDRDTAAELRSATSDLSPRRAQMLLISDDVAATRAESSRLSRRDRWRLMRADYDDLIS